MTNLIFLIPGTSHAGVVYGFIFYSEGIPVNWKVKIVCPETVVEGWIKEGYFELLIPEDDVECWIQIESPQGEIESAEELIYSFAEPTNYDFIFHNGELHPDN